MPSITLAYKWAVETCNNPNVGYSKDWRNQQTVNGITYYDCSSFIWYALKTGGWDVEAAYKAATGTNYWGNAWVTQNMDVALRYLGFTRYDARVASNWHTGDILLNTGASEHTEMVYDAQNHQSMGAHTDSIPLADQVSIRSYSSLGYWLYGYHWPGGTVNPGVTASPYVIAAMCGNFSGESTVNPGIWEGLVPHAWDYIHGSGGTGGGFGLGQWTNVGEAHGRCWKLHDWVTQNGYTDGDGYGQLAFLIHENYWTANPSADTPALGYQNLTEFLSSTSTDLYSLTHDWLICWEGIGTSTLPNRYSMAQQFLSYIQAHANDDPSQYTWISGNRYLSTAEQLNNVMCIYFWFGDLAPFVPQPDFYTHRKSMPIYFMLRRRRY